MVGDMPILKFVSTTSFCHRKDFHAKVFPQLFAIQLLLCDDNNCWINHFLLSPKFQNRPNFHQTCILIDISEIYMLVDSFSINKIDEIKEFSIENYSYIYIDIFH
jgi:hypothetical protein